MPNLKTGLTARLNTDAGMVAAIGQRHHWDAVPQGTALPYARLTVISDPRPQTLKAYHSARVARVQADFMGADNATVQAAAEAFIVAVAHPATAGGIRFGRGKCEGPEDGGEDIPGTGFVHRASVDLLVEFTLA